MMQTNQTLYFRVVGEPVLLRFQYEKPDYLRDTGQARTGDELRTIDGQRFVLLVNGRIEQIEEAIHCSKA